MDYHRMSWTAMYCHGLSWIVRGGSVDDVQDIKHSHFDFYLSILSLEYLCLLNIYIYSSRNAGTKCLKPFNI